MVFAASATQEFTLLDHSAGGEHAYGFYSNHTSALLNAALPALPKPTAIRPIAPQLAAVSIVLVTYCELIYKEILLPCAMMVSRFVAFIP